jgi:hypothetical protein
MSMINSNDEIGNRIRDLPACSSVPQPTAEKIYSQYNDQLTNILRPLTESAFSNFIIICQIISFS